MASPQVEGDHRIRSAVRQPGQAPVVDGHSHTQEIGASIHWTLTGAAQLGQYNTIYALTSQFFADTVDSSQAFVQVTPSCFCTLSLPCGDTDVP